MYGTPEDVPNFPTESVQRGRVRDETYMSLQPEQLWRARERHWETMAAPSVYTVNSGGVNATMYRSNNNSEYVGPAIAMPTIQMLTQPSYASIGTIKDVIWKSTANDWAEFDIAQREDGD